MCDDTTTRITRTESANNTLFWNRNRSHILRYAQRSRNCKNVQLDACALTQYLVHVMNIKASTLTNEQQRNDKRSAIQMNESKVKIAYRILILSRSCRVRSMWRMQAIRLHRVTRLSQKRTARLQLPEWRPSAAPGGPGRPSGHESGAPRLRSGALSPPWQPQNADTAELVSAAWDRRCPRSTWARSGPAPPTDSRRPANRPGGLTKTAGLPLQPEMTHL